jgi:NADP-dependent alcohol dehydrogenase
MENFYYFNPTKLLFGQGMLANIVHEIPKGKRILLIYGLGSIKTNGIYSQVIKELYQYEIHEFLGIKSNPDYETCMEAILFIKEKKIDFLLAIGGGSVIDATKFISIASYYNETIEPWDFMLKNKEAPTESIPFGCVLTVPGTGSEMNNGFVISRYNTKEKISYSSIFTYPKFSIIDPTFSYSLSREQRSNGITDTFIHVLEQYMVEREDYLLHDRQSEAILLEIIDIAGKVINIPNDYNAMSSFLWCSTQALNSHLSRGVKTDWSTHFIGHEITAEYGIDHAKTLSILLCGVWRNQFDYKKNKLAQYANRVFNMEGNIEELANSAILNTEKFMKELNMPTRFSDCNLDATKICNKILQRIAKKEINLGENKNINANNIKEIILSRA